MNWEAAGAIGEIVAAFAVVITLVYLAISIRQTARSISIAGLRDVTAQWNQWSEMLATSPELADVVARGNVDPATLSASEALRYGAFIQSFFDNVESYRTLVTDHGMDKDLQVLASIVSRRVTIPGFAAWWEENTADYGDDFIAWVEDIRREAS